MSLSSDLTAGQVRHLLQLEASRTCGFGRATYTGDRQIAPGALAPPLAAARPLGSALYFLVTPLAPSGCTASRTTSSIPIISAIRSSWC